MKPLPLLLSALCTSFNSCHAAKQVFAHYMVGSMTSSEAQTDVRDAQSAGIDAFVLNVHSTDSWATSAVQDLFDAANSAGFKLFFSFDMTYFTDPSQFLSLMEQHAGDSAYFLENGKPFVSTYKGGTMTFGQGSANNGWDRKFRNPLKAKGVDPFFVPDFDDWSGYPHGFFDVFPVVDGAFSWESAWPQLSEGKVNVSDGIDRAALEGAHAKGKVYMMPLSTLQFKSMEGNSWYRIGEVNYPQRMAQILSLQPDFVEVVTWNDAGESHYVGDFWPEQIAGSNIGSYANGFDHKAWLQVLTPFINAYKSGARNPSQVTPPGNAPVGAMWYRTVLTSASCSSGIEGAQNAEDTINFAVVLPEGSWKVNVYSNDKQIASYKGQQGLNSGMALGLQAGSGSGQRVEVVDGAGKTVAAAFGQKDVVGEMQGGVCNYNYEVVGLSSA